jgi:2-amino-4-hydroxy-6-hydroxymethyldihydropteridine diphosphokinase
MNDQKKHTVYLSLGTNLGNKKKNLVRIAKRLSEAGMEVIRSSGIYRSPAWGYRSENDYYNQCLACTSDQAPEVLMEQILSLEKAMGRKRGGEGYADRIIDVDMLFYDDLVMDRTGLTLPHPRIQERLFVLLPMNELAPDLVHPRLGMRIRDLLEAVEDNGTVERLPDE